jgi:hypothetical protein
MFVCALFCHCALRRRHRCAMCLRKKTKPRYTQGMRIANSARIVSNGILVSALFGALGLVYGCSGDDGSTTTGTTTSTATGGAGGQAGKGAGGSTGGSTTGSGGSTGGTGGSDAGPSDGRSGIDSAGGSGGAGGSAGSSGAGGSGGAVGGSAGSGGASGSAGHAGTAGTAGHDSGSDGHSGMDAPHGDAHPGDGAHHDAQGDDASGGDGGTAVPGTPVLVSATLVTHGTMSLVWQNPASTCATVEVNRKVGAGTYSVAHTLSGQTTSVQDMPGHAAGTYCYTVICKLNGLASSPSNERCVTQ